MAHQKSYRDYRDECYYSPPPSRKRKRKVRRPTTKTKFERDKIIEQMLGKNSKPIIERDFTNSTMSKEQAQQILGVDNPSHAIVKAAFKKLAQKHHPDKNGSALIFSNISIAKAILLGA